VEGVVVQRVGDPLLTRRSVYGYPGGCEGGGHCWVKHPIPVRNTKSCGGCHVLGTLSSWISFRDALCVIPKDLL
jgi:hypothetical protein